MRTGARPRWSTPPPHGLWASQLSVVHETWTRARSCCHSSSRLDLLSSIIFTYTRTILLSLHYIPHIQITLSPWSSAQFSSPGKHRIQSQHPTPTIRQHTVHCQCTIRDRLAQSPQNYCHTTNTRFPPVVPATSVPSPRSLSSRPTTRSSSSTTSTTPPRRS